MLKHIFTYSNIRTSTWRDSPGRWRPIRIMCCTRSMLEVNEVSLSDNQYFRVVRSFDRSDFRRIVSLKGIFSFRDVIFNLYGDYDADTRKAFLELWKAVGPLLVPGTEPILSNSVCIEPISQSFSKAKGNLSIKRHLRSTGSNPSRDRNRGPRTSKG